MVGPVSFVKVGSCRTSVTFVVKFEMVVLWCQRSSTDTYGQMVRHLSRRYTAVYLNAETESKIAHYVKPSTISSLEFSNELRLKMLRCSHVCDKYLLKGIVIKGLPQSVWRSMLATGLATRLHRCKNWRITPHR